ncbi:MAG: RidA family protein [Pseudomonadota bacterium]
MRFSVLASSVIALALSACGGGGSSPPTGEITRNPIPGSDFPISQSVLVTAGSDLLFVSGAVPPAIVEGGSPMDISTYGDTETQTVNVLTAISGRLESAGYSLGDVVMMRAYLVADPMTDRMDFEGFMAGYTQFFGTDEQPNLPSRSAIEIAGLAAPGWLVEIEVVAAKGE